MKTLEVGCITNGDITINLPPGEVGHISFTRQQAGALARVLLKHATNECACAAPSHHVAGPQLEQSGGGE